MSTRHDGADGATDARRRPGDRRAREPGLLGGPVRDLRRPRLHRHLPVPALQGGAVPVAAGRCPRPRRAPARPDPLRLPELADDERPGRVSRQRTGGLVRGRAADRVPGDAARPRGVEGARRAQGRPDRLGGDLLRDPRRLPAPRLHAGPRESRRGLRPRAGCPRARGLPDDHPARRRDHLGRDPRGHPQHLRRRRHDRGRPPDAATRRDAHRVRPPPQEDARP